MSAFSEHCSDIVKDYVQTVLIIDDCAGLVSQVNTGIDEKVVDLPVNNPLTNQETVNNNEDISEPGENSSAGKTKIATESSEETPNESSHFHNTTGHELNALELTNAFYQDGIVAGLYQPQIVDGENADEFASKIERVASTADIIILDWMLKERDSSYSKAIIKKIIDLDRSSGERIRNIIIYTGEPDLAALKDELYSMLNDDNIDNENEFQLSSQNFKISFYNKPNSNARPEREVRESDLPAKALKEFESLVNGLVPIFAMKAAATIRKNTGRIISKFGSELDIAYLAHRALLPSVEDSEVFMLDNFVSYLRNILAINKVDKKTLDKECISKWIDENDESISKVIVYKDLNYTLTKEELKLFITEGFLSDIKPTLLNHFGSEKKVDNFVNSNTSILNLTRILNKHDNDNYVEDCSKTLSILASFRRTFQDLIIGIELPYLTQGSLIYHVNEKAFLLCITPKCDTARVEKSRVFSFTRLTRLSKGQNFDLIIPIMGLIEESIDQDLKTEKSNIITELGHDPYMQKTKSENDKKAIKRLDQIEKYFYPGKVFVKSESSFFDLVHVEFNSNISNRVMPEHNVNGTLEYSSKDTDQKYIWIGDLEDLDTQNRVSNLVGNLNRIGTNEVEWLRRQSNK
jgi:hypothetical protein